MSTPSRRRREGRMAFHRGGNPLDYQPYKGCGLTSDLHATDWLEGWNQAKSADEIAQINEDRADEIEFSKLQEFVRLYELAKSQGLI
jgi:hypothetical protein